MCRRYLLAIVVVLFAGQSAQAGPPVPEFKLDPVSVQRCGPAFRYPQAGWIVVHIEGEPYERGYQLGHLTAPEIVDYIRALATTRSPKAPADAWRSQRLLVNALFLRKYEKEYLEEMRGIADGAAAVGAKWDGRQLDLLDIVGINSGIEIDFLESNLRATPTGLEGLRFLAPDYAKPKAMPMPKRTVDDPPMHCSAFAATGPATADGKIIFGHITMFGLFHVRHFNLWLDVKPARGHRVLMQTFPGGIMSGMDYYMNDAGILVAETTIAQTKFDMEGESMVSRIRKALQYGDSIDKVVELLGTKSNGVYTNEWLIGDTKTNEIAMFELGTHKSKLWRSSKNEWLGGTEGFYWGCNNAKDLDVRLETIPSVHGQPANMVFRPSNRDIKWIQLYEKHKGKITAEFGFEAFTTPPIAAFPSCDAKFTTSAMAKNLQTYAIFGPPLGRAWEPTDEERQKYPDIRPLVSNDWTVLGPEQSKSLARRASEGPVAGDLALKRHKKSIGDDDDGNAAIGELTPAWHGTLLPKTDADTWLAAAFAEYERVVALQKALKARAKDGKLSEEDKEPIEVAKFAAKARYSFAAQKMDRQDTPLRETRPDLRSDDWYEIAAGKGLLVLAQLRENLADDDRFTKLMDDFGRAHAGKPVTVAQFQEHVERVTGQNHNAFFGTWLGHGSSYPRLNGFLGNGWATTSFEKEPDRALIIYGTLKESHAQREAALLLQEKLRRRTGNYTVPIKADKEVTEAELKNNHLLLIGRPDSNAVLAKCAAELPVKFADGSFALRDKTYAHPASAIIAAGSNPHSPRYSIVAFAGLSAEATRTSVQKLPNRGGQLAPIMLLAAGEEPRLMVVKPLEKSALQGKDAGR
jgi:hypothetical protein